MSNLERAANSQTWKDACVLATLETINSFPEHVPNRKAKIAEQMKLLEEQLKVVSKIGEFDAKYLPHVVLKHQYKAVQMLWEHYGEVRDVQIMPNGRLLSIGGDQSVLVWSKNDKGTWEKIDDFGAIFDFDAIRAFSNTHIASVSNVPGETIATIFKNRQGDWKGRPLLSKNTERTTIAIGPGAQVFCGYKDGTISYMKNPRKNANTQVLDGHQGPITHLELLPTGQLMSRAEDTKILLWSKVNGGEGRRSTWKSELIVENFADVGAMHATINGRMFISNGHDLHRFTSPGANWESPQILQGHKARITAIQALPDGRCVSADSSGVLRLWCKDKNGIWQSEISSGHEGIKSLLMLKDGTLFTGHKNRCITVWDGKEL